MVLSSGKHEEPWRCRSANCLRARGAWSSSTSTTSAAPRLRSLWIALEQALAAGRQKTLWVAVTLSQSPVQADLARLLQFFPNTVELPPLRHHIEDLHQLVPFLLVKLNHGAQLALLT